MKKKLCKRSKRYVDDVWDLDHSIAKYVLPRLIKYKAIMIGHPILPEFYSKEDIYFENKESQDKNVKEWNIILDKMILAFRLMVKEDFLNDEQNKQVNEGLLLFGKHLRALWI